MNNYPVLWTNEALNDLDLIYEFYIKISAKVAKEIIAEIILKTGELRFAEQYQMDDLNPKYRRIIVKHYKVLYKLIKNTIFVIAVFDCRRNPKDLKKRLK